MNEDERAIRIARLLKERSEASARKSALLEDAYEFAARIHEIRAVFGNPFFYSHPENADESVANYSGTSSHKVVLPTMLALWKVNRELAEINDRLKDLGITSAPDSD